MIQGEAFCFHIMLVCYKRKAGISQEYSGSEIEEFQTWDETHIFERVLTASLPGRMKEVLDELWAEAFSLNSLSKKTCKPTRNDLQIL